MTTPVNTMIKQTFKTSAHAEQSAYSSFCGDIEYLINGNKEYITMDPAKKEITLLNTNGKHTKKNYVCLTSRLKKYPSNTVNQCFYATIESACGVSTFKAGLLLKSPLIHHVGEDSAQ
jgi:hypothetical protein